MTVDFPTNTVIILTLAITVFTAGAWVGLSVAIRRSPIAPQAKRRWRWGAGIVLLTLLLARWVLAQSSTVLGLAFVIPFAVVSLLAGILPLLLSPVFRQIVRSIPATWLYGLQAIRVFGGFYWLALADMKLLAPQFALSAGYADIVAGVLAPVMIYLLSTRKPFARALVIAWNVFGLLDFVNGYTTTFVFNARFIAQLAASGTSVHYMNYTAFISAFVVPLLIVLHIYSLFQLLGPRADEMKQRVKGAAGDPVFGENNAPSILKVHD